MHIEHINHYPGIDRLLDLLVVWEPFMCQVEGLDQVCMGEQLQLPVLTVILCGDCFGGCAHILQHAMLAEQLHIPLSGVILVPGIEGMAKKLFPAAPAKEAFSFRYIHDVV